MAREKSRSARMREIATIVEKAEVLPAEIAQSDVFTVIEKIIDFIMGCWGTKNAQRVEKKLAAAFVKYQSKPFVPEQVKDALAECGYTGATLQKRTFFAVLSTANVHKEKVVPLLCDPNGRD